VNLDHVATLRQVRRTAYPDVLAAAAAAERGGADGITVHLREDRVTSRRGCGPLRAHVTTKLNLEMAATGIYGGRRARCALRMCAWCRNAERN